jgi:thiamine biosynthesis lipoprotein
VYLYNFEAFTAPCELHIEAPTLSSANEAAQVVITDTKRLEVRYSFFNPASEVYALNHRSEHIQILSDELSGLIALALFYTEMTQGAFDIALAGTLKAASKASSLPEYIRLKEDLLPFASSQQLQLDGNSLKFPNNLTKIDLGGLVKEYAVDQAVLRLQNLGIKSALINFGGDISAYGTCHGSPWAIGIQDPEIPEQNLLEVRLDNRSLCTSGHSKRYVTIEDEKITHIVSSFAKTEHSYRQASIMAPTALDAGIWSTAILANPNLLLPAHIELVNAI